MENHRDESSHAICLWKFENNNRKYKGKILSKVTNPVCAMLNSNGGNVIISFETDRNDVPGERSLYSKIASVIRILEQRMISIIGENQTVSKIDFRDTKDSVTIFIEKADSLVTNSYNLYLPSVKQVVQLSPLEPIQNIKNRIMYRKAIPNPVELNSHCQLFCKDKNCGFQESKVIQFKRLKAEQSKRTTLADRMTSKGNKLTSYVSAFANYSGGHIYYGITDEGVVKGEFIPSEKNKEEIIKKVEKAINKMIWPEPIGQPKRGEQWEIFFESVADENFTPVPSTFVIVIYIASCLGGVFTEKPECYEMVDKEVMSMSFATWKERISGKELYLLQSHEKIQPVLQLDELTTWRSAEARKAFTDCETLRRLICNGNWKAISKECQILLSKSNLPAMKLLVLWIKITACCAQGKFTKACIMLKQYKTHLCNVQDTLIFEVIGLNLEAALKRAHGDFKGLKEPLKEALLKAEKIKPGLVTATVYIFAATVSDLLSLKEPTNQFSPEVFSTKALAHLQSVSNFPCILADRKQRVHIILATFYLGCNISGQLIKKTINISDIDKAKSSIMAVHESIYEGNPLSRYRQVQLKLVQSIYDYRHSQVSPGNKISLLRSAFDNAKDAESIAREHEFTEMVEWSKASETLCTEELLRSKIASMKPRGRILS